MSLDATSWVWRQKLSASEKLVLLSMADRAGEDHRCYPSISRMTNDTGLNRKTVQTVLQRLRTLGLVRQTGRMVGYNNSVPEYQLVGVQGREDTMPKNGHGPKLGAVDAPEKATSEDTMPENGPGPESDQVQNWGEHQAQKRVRHQAQNWATESPIESSMESSFFCSEPPEAHEPEAVLFSLPLKDGSAFDVSAALVAELAPLYPRVDMGQAFKAMKGWLIGNAAKRKTRRGIKKFITGWLAREQEKGPVRPGGYGGGQAALPRLDKAVEFVRRHVAAGEDAAAMVELFCQHNRLDPGEYEPVVLAALQAA